MGQSRKAVFSQTQLYRLWDQGRGLVKIRRIGRNWVGFDNQTAVCERRSRDHWRVAALQETRLRRGPLEFRVIWVQRSSSVRQGSQTQQCTTPYPHSLLCPWWVWSKYKLVCTSMPPGDEMSGRALKLRKRTNLDSHTSSHHATMSVSVHQLMWNSFQEALTNQCERCPALCFNFSLTLITHKNGIHVDRGGFLLWAIFSVPPKT